MEQLIKVLNSLKNECDNIRKLGSKRRLDKLGQQKYANAEAYYCEFKLILETLSSSAKLSDLELICVEIETVYKKILNFKQTDITENMEDFNLKTANSLIPIMDGKEETTERILEGIEMYDSCLKKEDNRKLLISFVLKTRLSKSAKLKLKSEYTTIESLIKDIKMYLLTKKSANSLLSQMNGLSQNNLSISEYGSKLEELFNELTMAQADGNAKASAILSPINEKIAIKRFSDGLRNRRLSTIIAAHNYSELKDAVRAAQDEELARPGSSGQDSIYAYRGISRNYHNYNRNQWNNRRGRGNTYRGRPQYQHYQHRGNQHQQNSRGFGYGNHGSYQVRNRGRARSNTNYRSGNQRKAYYASQNESEQKEEEVINLQQFFRV